MGVECQAPVLVEWLCCIKQFGWSLGLRLVTVVLQHKPEKEGPERAKGNRGPKVVYDPFKLVPCEPFSPEKQVGNVGKGLPSMLFDWHVHVC